MLQKFFFFFSIVIPITAFSSEFNEEFRKQPHSKEISSPRSHLEKKQQETKIIHRHSATAILPIEVWSHIFEYIDGKDFETLTFVCKVFYELHESPRLLHLRCKEYFYQAARGRFVEEQEIFNLSNKQLVCEKLRFLTSHLEHSGHPIKVDDAEQLIHNWQLFYDLNIIRIELGDKKAKEDLRTHLDAKKRAIKNFPAYCSGAEESEKLNNAIELMAFAQFCYSSNLSPEEVVYIFGINPLIKQQYLCFYAQPDLFSTLTFYSLRNLFSVQEKLS